MTTVTATRNAAESGLAPVQFTVERAHLLKALGHVQSVVEKRGTIPVLSNVKLEARGGELTLTATDMDIQLCEKVAAEVREAGIITVSAHMFYDIARKLPDGAQIELTAKESGRVAIRSGAVKFALASLPVDDFPVMSEGDFTHHFQLAAAECVSLIEKPAYAMSSEETRYYLNGIYLHAAGSGDMQHLRAVATDGHRLARVEVTLPGTAAGMPGIIVPRKTIFELRKIIEGGEGNVNISLSANKIRFAYGAATLTSKLIDGNFPDYDRVIPANNQKVLEVDRKAFTQAVDRVSVIASERTRAVKLSLEPGKLTVSANSAEAGSATEELEVSYSSDAMEIGFNSRYMLEMMSQIEGDTAQMFLNDGASPVLVRDTGDAGSLYVIMPMRV